MGDATSEFHRPPPHTTKRHRLRPEGPAQHSPGQHPGNSSLHPGEILKDLCLEPLNLSGTDSAKAFGVSRKTISSILNGRAGISPEMAIRLSIAFDTTSESWMNQQMQYDLWQAEQRRGELRVTSLTVP